MMKKIILGAGIALVFTVAVAAQTTKVSKQISVLPWLNTAVIDANEAAGGLHTYADWSTLGSSLKTAQVKVGMLVTITADKATYRLKSWAVTTALPTLGEWERVSDMIVVADIAARDALIVTDGSKISLAPGVTVVVKDNGSGLTQTYIYAAGLFDANGDGTVATDGTDNWYSAGSSTGSGYIFFDQVAPKTLTSAAQNGWDATGAATGITSTNKKLGSVPNGVTFTLTTGDTTVPQIALPATWANPVFYINDGTTSSLLSDCWVKSTQTIKGISYQVWVGDFSFLKDVPAGGTYTLEVH